MTTPKGSTAGEYLGMESSHGDRAILLRHVSGTDSIPLNHVMSIKSFGERASLRAVPRSAP